MRFPEGSIKIIGLVHHYLTITKKIKLLSPTLRKLKASHFNHRIRKAGHRALSHILTGLNSKVTDL